MCLCVSVCGCISVFRVVSLLLCHQHIQTTGALNDMWRQALQSSFIMTLCRDEVLLVHPFVISYFDTVRGYRQLLTTLHNTRAVEIYDCLHDPIIFVIRKIMIVKFLVKVM